MSSYNLNSSFSCFSSASFSTYSLIMTALGSDREYTGWPIPYTTPDLSNASPRTIFLMYSRICSSSVTSSTLQCMFFIISMTLRSPPPLSGPLSEQSAAATVAYVSEPDDVTTRVVNVELLPPPCSMWRTRARSRTFASSCVYFLSERSMLRIFSANESSGSGLCI